MKSSEINVLNSQELALLRQLIQSFEEITKKLERAYENNNYDELGALKMLLIRTQKKIADLVR